MREQIQKNSMLIVIPNILEMIIDHKIRTINFSHAFYRVISQNVNMLL